MPESPEALAARITHMATFIAKYLQTITPYERALVLHEAEVMWEEMQGKKPEELVELQAREDAKLLISQWLGSVAHRLDPEALTVLVEVAKQLDDAGKLQRMVGEP